MNAKRRQMLFAAAGIAALFAVLALLVVRDARDVTQTPQRVAFQIVTGSTSGSNFRVGELLAGLLSHPPGIGRCDNPARCAPAGVIVSTRATQGSTENILGVVSGAADSGLAQANVIALAVAGQPPFRNAGPARALRSIGRIYSEDLHLVAARKAELLSVSDLRGKRVSLAPEGTETNLAARAVLQAYRLPIWRLAARYDRIDDAAQRLRSGELDAFFVVGGTPARTVTRLLEDDVAVLIPIDGAARMRLLAQQKQLVAHTVPLGTYPGTPPLDTVAVPTHWVTLASQPDDLIYGLVRALFHPENRAAIATGRSGYDFLDPDLAAKDLVAPLHPGAARYFREAGVPGQPSPP